MGDERAFDRGTLEEAVGPMSLTKAYLPFKGFTSGASTLLDFCLELIPWLCGGWVDILMTP